MKEWMQKYSSGELNSSDYELLDRVATASPGQMRWNSIHVKSTFVFNSPTSASSAFSFLILQWD